MKRSSLKRKTPLRSKAKVRLIRLSISTQFPKPKDIYRETSSVIYYPDGREVCCIRTRQGSAEYKRRTTQMAERQGWLCCLYGICPDCPGVMTPETVSFEHENGRGGGKRDDRIVLPDGTRINGAAHVQCNQWKGSRRIPYNAERNGKGIK